ncbi:MAG TPA: F-box protein [Candidatus Saccharimonadales bacterium]|nr:F-box protein [Candidatus Saccharimonadales bacterium]
MDFCILSQSIRQVDLNDDVLREILSHADIQSVFRFCQVNKTLFNKQHDDLFRHIYERLYHQTDMSEIKNKTSEMTWHQLLKLCYQLSRLFILLPSLKEYTMKELYTTTELNLSHQKITVLPPEIGQLRDLKVLDLTTNQLNALPPEMGQLGALQDLYLLNNKLSELPPEIGQLSALQILDLDNNQLRALPPEISQLRALQRLYVSNNNLSSPFIKKLKQQLPNSDIY